MSRWRESLLIVSLLVVSATTPGPKSAVIAASYIALSLLAAASRIRAYTAVGAFPLGAMFVVRLEYRSLVETIAFGLGLATFGALVVGRPAHSIRDQPETEP